MPSAPPQKEYKFVNSLWCAYIMSVIAAWHAEFVTYPLDLVKTRLQIQGELQKRDKQAVTQYRGMLRTGYGIAVEEGILKLWQGVSAAFFRHSIYSGIRIVVYRNLKEDFFHHPHDDFFPLWKSALCGVTAGAVAQWVANPADLLKIHLQMEGKRRLMGLPSRVDGIMDAYKKVVKQSGYRGLYKGSVPNVQRAALVNLGDLTAYDSAKRIILINTSLEDTHFVHILSSFCAGFVAAVMGTPADVIKSRVMNQPLDKDGRGLYYKNSIDCLRKTVAAEGAASLYKGFLPIWYRMAPWSLTFWIIYEETSLRVCGQGH